MVCLIKLCCSFHNGLRRTFQGLVNNVIRLEFCKSSAPKQPGQIPPNFHQPVCSLFCEELANTVKGYIAARFYVARLACSFQHDRWFVPHETDNCNNRHSSFTAVLSRSYERKFTTINRKIVLNKNKTESICSQQLTYLTIGKTRNIGFFYSFLYTKFSSCSDVVITLQTPSTFIKITDISFHTSITQQPATYV